MKKRRPQTEHALDYLLSLLSQPNVRSGMQLPSVSQLCERANVARATMVKAVRRLCSRGILRTVRGHGLFVEQPVHSASPSTDDTTTDTPMATGTPRKWEMIAAQLEKDIFLGRYSFANKLPGMKTLANSYNTCHQTLRKGVRTLIAKGIIQPARSGYVIAPVASNRSENAVYVIMHDFGRISVYDEAFHDYLRLVEQACSEMELKLKFLFFRHKDDGIEIVNHRDSFLGNAVSRDQTLGVVMGNPGFLGSSFRELVHQVCLAGKPASILDRIGTATQLITPTAAKRTRVFLMGPGPRPGYDVGRFLLMSGHRHATYISPFHHQQWASDRFAGLQKAFSEAGIAEGVDCLSPQNEDIESIRGVVGESLQHVNYALDAPEFMHRKWFRGLLHSGKDSKLAPVVRDIVSYSMVRDVLYPHLERLLSNPEISAWIAANDTIATVCMDFLRARNVKVPSRVSVVSFDNSAVSFMKGITTYDFNVHKVVHAMLQHIARPSLSPRHTVIDSPGEIRVRASTQ